VATGAANSARTSIIDGSSNVMVYGTWGEVLSSQVTDIASKGVLSQDTYDYTDNLHRSYTVTHLDGTVESVNYACCGLNAQIDRDGVMTQYFYDAAKRQVATSRLGIMVTNVLDASGKVLETIRIGTNGSPILVSGMAYDDSGTLIRETNALLGVTTHSQSTNSAGETVDTVTNPDLGTVITTSYLDGSVLSIGGTAAHGKVYSYGASADVNGAACSYTTETSLDASGNSTAESTTTYTDMAGRTAGVRYADNSHSTNYFNSLGQLSKSVDPDGVSTLYQYGAKGEQVVTAVDMNGNGSIDSGDRVAITTNDVMYDSVHGATVRRTRTYVSSMDDANRISMVETSADGLNTWQTCYGPSSSVTNHSSTVYNGSSRTATVTAEDGSSVVTLYINGVRQSVTLYTNTTQQIGGTTFAYDPHGRLQTASDARNGPTSYGYNNADQVSTNTTPPPVPVSPA